jgi:hypothetical protein
MPVISCPSCQGKLRFPDDSPPRRVKCPTCGHVFLGSAGSAAPDAGNRGARADDKDDDRGRGGRRREDNDEDNRRTRRRRDNDDDDRPPRRRQDEDDDYDRRRREGDDDYDRRLRSDPRAVEGQFNRASLACLLCFIAGWLQVGALGITVFVAILSWAEIREGLNFFVIVGGLAGLGGLLTAAVGYGFLVSGPRDRGALGLAIATAAVAGFHLILVVLIATTSAQNVRDDQYAGVNWYAFVTETPTIPRILFWIIGRPEMKLAGARAVLPAFASLAEVTKVVLFLLTLRAVLRCARDPRRARLCMQALLANAIGFGVLVFLGLLFGLLALAVGKEKGGWVAVNSVFTLAVSMIVAAMIVWATMVTRAAKEGLDYRPD